MGKQISLLLVLLLSLISLNGCLLLAAGAAGGGGTAVWMSEKAVQEADASLEQGFSAARNALKSLGYTITKEVRKSNVAQVKGKYTDGKTIWIDVHLIASNRIKIGVRVGMMGDDEAEAKILRKVMSYL
jgi:hypothetical protein